MRYFIREFIILDKSKVSSEQSMEKKRQIAIDLIDAMRNHPPSIQDMHSILGKIKEAFPELEVLKGPMSQLPGEITQPWFEMLPIYDEFRTVERNLKKKPLHPEDAKNAFAHLLYLTTLLLFKNDLIDIGKEQEVAENEWAEKEIRAEQIQFNIMSCNALFKKIAKSNNALIFREDVSDFFVKLPTRCKGKEDFFRKNSESRRPF